MSLSAKKSINKKFMFVLVGVLIFSTSLFGTLYAFEYQSNITELNKETIISVIKYTSNDQSLLLNFISNSIKNFYLNSEIVTSYESHNFMKNIIDDMPIIKDILIINGSKVIVSYPIYDFEGLDIADVIPNITVKTFDTDVVLVVFPVTNELQSIFVLPVSYLSLHNIIPINSYSLVLKETNSNIVFIENIKNGNILTNDVYTNNYDSSIVVKVDTELVNFKTNKPMTLEYSLSYISQESFNRYVDYALLFSGCFFSVLVPILLIRTESFSRLLKNKTDQLQTSNDILSKTQKLLLKSEEEFRYFFNFAPYPMIVITSEGKIKLVNEAYEHTFQFSAHDIIGKSIFEVNPDEYEKMKKYLEEWNKDGLLENKEITGMKKDGTKIPLLVSAGQTMNSSGKPSDAIVVLIDQTKEYQINKLKQDDN